MKESPSTLTTLTESELYQVAIHEAGHLVVRYLAFGSIDTIRYVSIVPNSNSFGRNKENLGKKDKEFEESLNDISVFCSEEGFAFKECCYALGGFMADKIYLSLNDIPYEHSDIDILSLYGYLGQFLDPSEIDSVLDAAIPKTEEFVKQNFDLIKKVAEALINSPEHQLDNPSLVKLLTT